MRGGGPYRAAGGGGGAEEEAVVYDVDSRVVWSSSEPFTTTPYIPASGGLSPTVRTKLTLTLRLSSRLRRRTALARTPAPTTSTHTNTHPRSQKQGRSAGTVRAHLQRSHLLRRFVMNGLEAELL